jgi:hypothetical protein
LSGLEKKLVDETEASMGWAERILGKPIIPSPKRPEPPISSFAVGRIEPTAENPKPKCERCGAEVGSPGIVCSQCGDKLPSIIGDDEYIKLVLRGLWTMLAAPRSFAINFPYPQIGGTIQILYAGVAGGCYVLSLLFLAPDKWLGENSSGTPVMALLAGFLVALALVPAVLSLSSWLLTYIARAFGGIVPLRRTTRVAGAYVFWIFTFGALYNLLLLWLYLLQLHLRLFPTLGHFYRAIMGDSLFMMLGSIAILTWLCGWAFGALFRLTWIRTLWLIVISFGLFIPLWLLLFVILPLRFAGIV